MLPEKKGIKQELCKFCYPFLVCLVKTSIVLTTNKSRFATEQEDYEKSRSGINGLEERQPSQQKWKILPGEDIEMLSKTSSICDLPCTKGSREMKSTLCPWLYLYREREALKALSSCQDFNQWLFPSSVPQRFSRRMCCHQASTGQATYGIRQQDCHAKKCHLLSGLFLKQCENTLPMAHTRELQQALEFFCVSWEMGSSKASISKVLRAQRQAKWVLLHEK